MFPNDERSAEGYDINGSIYFTHTLQQFANQKIFFHKGRYTVSVIGRIHTSMACIVQMVEKSSNSITYKL